MRILKLIVIAVVVLLAVLAGVGMLLPRHSHVERSIVIEAPTATVFALIDGYKQFQKWSPWAAQDPDATYTVEGPEFGVGAKQSWVGDPKTVGSGSQEIIATEQGKSVTTRLDFGGNSATANFALSPEGSGTNVTWSFEADNGAGPVGRYFGLLMDRFIGPDYEKGLANLKALAEALPKADFADLAVTKVDAPPVTVAYVAAQSGKETHEIGEAIGAAYAKVVAFMKVHGLTQAGPPITINTRWDDAGYGFDAAIPVDKTPEKEVPADSPVKVKQTYAGKALKVVFKGPYGGMASTYEKLDAYVAARGYESVGPPWDEYVSDPGTTPEAELITNIYWPVK